MTILQQACNGVVEADAWSRGAGAEKGHGAGIGDEGQGAGGLIGGGPPGSTGAGVDFRFQCRPDDGAYDGVAMG